MLEFGPKGISVVIPCYGSEHTIADVVDEVCSTIQQRAGLAHEIILVNDHSPDNVHQVLNGLAAGNKRIKVISLARNFGQHAACMAGYRYCAYDVVLTLDDDGQTPADEMFKLLDKIEEGYDVVYASYGEIKQTSFRILGSKINQKMLEVMIGKPRHITANSYYACRRFVIDEILRYSHSYPYLGGLVFRATQNIANVPVVQRSRQTGRSGYTLRKLISLWLNGFTAFSVYPLRVATIMGILCAVVGFIVTIYTVVTKILHPDIQAGYSSTMAALLFIGGMMMMMMGIIGEYIGRMYISINNSPQYVIRETVNITEDRDKNE